MQAVQLQTNDGIVVRIVKEIYQLEMALKTVNEHEMTYRLLSKDLEQAKAQYRRLTGRIYDSSIA